MEIWIVAKFAMPYWFAYLTLCSFSVQFILVMKFQEAGDYDRKVEMTTISINIYITLETHDKLDSLIKASKYA